MSDADILAIDAQDRLRRLAAKVETRLAELAERIARLDNVASDMLANRDRADTALANVSRTLKEVQAASATVADLMASGQVTNRKTVIRDATGAITGVIEHGPPSSA